MVGGILFNAVELGQSSSEGHRHLLVAGRQELRDIRLGEHFRDRLIQAAEFQDRGRFVSRFRNRVLVRHSELLGEGLLQTGDVLHMGLLVLGKGEKLINPRSTPVNEIFAFLVRGEGDVAQAPAPVVVQFQCRLHEDILALPDLHPFRTLLHTQGLKEQTFDRAKKGLLGIADLLVVVEDERLQGRKQDGTHILFRKFVERFVIVAERFVVLGDGRAGDVLLLLGEQAL